MRFIPDTDRANFSEFYDLEPDYDLEEDAVKMADAHVIMLHDTFHDRMTTSRDPLIKQERISMGTLSDSSRHSRPSSSEKILTIDHATLAVKPKVPPERKTSATVTLQVPEISPQDHQTSSRTRKKSSATSAEIDIHDLENDPDFGEDFNAMLRQRKRSFRAGKKGKSTRRSRRLSNRSRDGRGSEGQVGE